MVALVALLDANVLWSAAVRDTLLLAAEHDLFLPVWSRRILDEVARTLKRRRPDLDPTRIDRTIDLILRAFPEALVEEYEAVIPVMTNDEGDRHVLAAAVHAGAAVVVTENVRHFPEPACSPYGIEIHTADEFLSRLWVSDPSEMALVLREQAAHLTTPPQTMEQILATLSRSVPRFVELATRSTFQ